MRKKLGMLAAFGLAGLFIIGGQTIVSAQGRGGGGGARSSGNSGMGGQGMGRPSGTGVDRGVSTSSGKSEGRADKGRDTASERSNGRSDAGLERARLQRENARHADEELGRHPQMASRLHTTANDLRSGYQAALGANPDLKFGQYVAATRLAANLGAKNPNIRREAILGGLAGGKSVGQTLQDLGLSEREAKEAKNRAEREVKEAQRP